MKAATIAFISALVGALTVYLAAVKEEPVTDVPVIVTGGRGGASAGRGGIGGTGGSVLVDAGSPVVVPPSTVKTGFSIGLQSWFVDPSWTGEKLFSSPGVISQSYVDSIKPFSVFRTMDATSTNCSIQKEWSDRRLPTDADQTAYAVCGDSTNKGVAWEYLIDIVNAANVGLWVNIPHQASDDYVRNLASLLKGRLKTQLYVEYSNETWNGAFGQFNYVNSTGTKLGLPGSNTYYQGGAYTLYRGLQAAKIVKDSIPSAKYVFAFSGNQDLADQAIKNVASSSQWNPSSTKIDLLATAPYVTIQTYSLAAFKSKVDSLVASDDGLGYARRIADKYGYPVGCYEGGGDIRSNATSYANAADSADAYTYMLDKFATKANAPCALYTRASSYNATTAWGLYGADGKASPRLAAVLNWISSHK